MLTKIPLVKNYFFDLDENVKKFGLSAGFNEFLKKLNSKLIVDNLTENNQKILSKKPCLIIATHPYLLEMFPIFASLPQRNDCRLVLNFELFGLCPNVDKKSLPVYIKHDPIKSYKEKFFNSFLKYLHQSESFEKDIAHQKNIGTVSMAAKIINRGGSVIIFPEGRGRNNNWKTGVGWLVSQIANKDAYYIFVYNKGHFSDYLRFLYQFGRILPPFKVSFSDVKKISALIKRKPDPKQIALNLEKEYKNWSKDF